MLPGSVNSSPDYFSYIAESCSTTKGSATLHLESSHEKESTPWRKLERVLLPLCMCVRACILNSFGALLVSFESTHWKCSAFPGNLQIVLGGNSRERVSEMEPTAQLKMLPVTKVREAKEAYLLRGHVGGFYHQNNCGH